MKTNMLKPTLFALAVASAGAHAGECPPAGQAQATPPASQARPAAPQALYYNPWADLMRMQAMQNALFNPRQPMWRPVIWGTMPAPMPLPASRLQLTDDGYRLELPLPAYKPEDVHVRLDGRLLTITAETANTVKAEGGDTQSRQSFAETLTLPGEVQPSALKQKFENGVLTITLPAAKPSGGAA